MNTTNTNITFKGTKLTLSGKPLRVGDAMPLFTLTAHDLSDLKNDTFKGKILIISSVPSLDTPVCSIQTRRFNQFAEELSPKICVLTISMDLPFAQKRWCGAESCQRVTCASDYKYRSFGKAFGVFIEEWGLLSRALFVVDQKGKIAYLEYVPEVSHEPDYDSALSKAKALVET